MYKIKILIEVIETPDLNIIDCKNVMEVTTTLLQKMIQDEELNNLISAAKSMAKRFAVDADTDFKRHHRRRIVPKKLDANNDNQEEFDLFLYYRKEFRVVTDTLVFKLCSSIKHILDTLSPMFAIFNFPLKVDKLKLEDIEALLQMLPSTLQKPDSNALLCELEILFTACDNDNVSTLQEVIAILTSKYKVLHLARYMIQFVVTAGYVTATNERSFSQLKIVKNLLRTSMGDERLSDLMLLKCEKKLAESLDYSQMISSWGKLKERRIKIK